MKHKHTWVRVEAYICASDLQCTDKYELVIWDCNCGARKRVKVKGKQGLSQIWKECWNRKSDYYCNMCKAWGPNCVCGNEDNWTKVL